MASAGPRQAGAPFQPDIHLLIPVPSHGCGRSRARRGDRASAL